MDQDIVGVQFYKNNKIYYFRNNEFNLEINDKVVVETVRGFELAKVARFYNYIDEQEIQDFELKPIIRKATKKDEADFKANLEHAKVALEKCRQIVAKFELPMNLIKCDYTLDRTKAAFMYTADQRVDFRDLLKELAFVFKCRIELRQVGVRDKAKVVGDIGICGLPICCSNFLDRIGGISITMAKNQSLSLNVQKLSGACGKLMCCLKYENDNYIELRKEMPKIGDAVYFEGIKYHVTSINLISQEMSIMNADNIAFVKLNEVSIRDATE